MPYPAYPVVQDESEAVQYAGLEVTRATNGLLKTRRLYSEEKTDFVIVHVLTRAERDALAVHYAANRTAQFSFYWAGDGATYTCVYADAPQFSRRHNHYRAIVRLSQV